ncbi:MAG: YoaK family protein [Phormidesmis sp.]
MTTVSQPNKSFTISSFLTGDKPAGFLLSLVAGFVDTAAFIILFGIFTAHVTGNIALAGSSFVSDDEESTLTRLLMLPAFMVTVALTSVLARYARRKQWPVFAVLLTAEAIALSIFLVIGAELSPALLLDVQEEYILPIGLSGVVAMAIQNTLMKEARGVFKSYIPTTVMTGNTTQLTIDLVQLIGAKLSAGEQAEQEASESIERISRYVPVIVGFALGGAAAAFFILASETWWSLVFPLVIVVVLAIAAYIQHAREAPVS